VSETLDPALYYDIVRRALDEDVGAGDVTTEAVVDADRRARGVFLVKEACVVAGLDVAIEAFRLVEPGISVDRRRHDGDRASVGDVIAEVAGRARTLLAAERTALNFLQRLSGIATLARRFVDEAGGRIVVLDTRKTTPTLRVLEKYAVRMGGATNHRVALYDAVLIKENHARLAGSIGAAVARVRAARPGMPVEVEAQSLAEVDEALAAGADTILVDNLSTADARKAVVTAGGRARIEISGGVSLARMGEISATGADFVSVGAITHSAPAVDISFEIEHL
jgi:nicotinate-nucleotide pyrophosphorylase (carboxylating)